MRTYEHIFILYTCKGTEYDIVHSPLLTRLILWFSGSLAIDFFAYELVSLFYFGHLLRTPVLTETPDENKDITNHNYKAPASHITTWMLNATISSNCLCFKGQYSEQHVTDVQRGQIVNS